MVQAETRFVVDEETRTLHVELEDFEVLETGDADVLVLNLNELAGTPPFYIEVGDRRFALQRDTYQVRGHGAELPAWLRAEETDGRLVLLAEREERFLIYVHDPTAEAEEDEE
jgi:hypothetical protein